MDITSFGLTIEGDRGASYHKIETLNDIYQHAFAGGDEHFSDSGLKDWTEPLYIINIIQTGKNVSDDVVDNYKSTGAYVKVESIIGEGDGTTVNPSFELVDERWEDVLSVLDSSHPNASQDRFIFLDDGNIKKAWINVNYKTPAQKTTISNDITTNGFYDASGTRVYGMYTVGISADQREFTVDFSESGYNTVPQGDLIYVNYNNQAPILAFGGDTYVGESVFSFIDRKNLRDDSDNKDTQFNLGLGFPFKKYYVTPRYYIPKSRTNIQNSLNLGIRQYGELNYLRQHLLMYCAESRAASPYYFSGTGSTQQFFPDVHYVIRMNDWRDDEIGNGAAAFYADNNVYASYDSDYGDEFLIWEYGGFRFSPQNNTDYSQRGVLEYVSKPEVGFTDENEFCTGIAYSQARAINQQDSPGLKTFLPTNIFEASDDQGAIVKAWDASSGKGDNLYAFCERGVLLLLTEKSILSSVDASEIQLFATSNVIQGEYWLDKRIGMNDEMWRSFSEESLAILTEEGVIRTEGCLFANRDSVFKFINNRLTDIGKDGYYTKLRKKLKSIRTGYTDRVTSFYDKKYDEYGLQIESLIEGSATITEETLFSYSQLFSAWQGVYDYRFDQYMFQDGDLYGLRDGETYLLDDGYEINGSSIVYEVTASFSPQKALEKEFIDININTSPRANKPTRIEFYDEEMNPLAIMEEGIQGPRYLKLYDGWRQFIPRKQASVSPTRDLIQDRLLIYKIIHNLDEDFRISEVIIQYKVLK